VLAVVGFHAAPGVVPGGFVGVDVFFVISGFLISGILFTQLEQGQFTFADFYARRIRRIFPALVVVLAACWAIGWYVLIGDEYKHLQKHLAGGSLFVSNILLWREAGYFDEPSAFKPLLHLWSLAIEEQFYLLWPPLLYLWWKRGLNVVTIILLIIAFSFSLNVTLIQSSRVAAFYLPTSRMWELMLGALLAYIECFRKERVDAAVKRLVFAAPVQSGERIIANGKAWIGLGFVLLAMVALGQNAPPLWWSHRQTVRDLAAVVGLDKGTFYPGWWAALPTLGTALVLWAGRDAWVNRTLLARRPVVYIGLISYPLYLWHWPLLSFLQITESRHPSKALNAAAIALAFVLASLTYHFVEQPIRRTTSVRTPMRVAAIAAVTLLVGVISLYSYNTGALRPMTPNFPTELASGIPSPRHDPACSQRFPTSGEYCQVYAEGLPVTTALVGDSHAEHFLNGVGANLLKKGETVVHLGESGCPPLFNVQRRSVDRMDTCHTAVPSVINYVGNASAVTRVILSFRGVLDATGTGYGEDRLLTVAYGVAPTHPSAADAIRQALGETVDYLVRQKHKTVWLILQVPELSFNLGDCTGRPVSFESRHLMSPCAEPKAAVLNRQAPYRQIVDEVKRRMPDLNVFDPLPYLCDEQWCYAIRDKQLLYVDYHHLSREGSLFFADKFTF
jgi:peptidoglycan/LPS O-acetylase OafA/YrhL